MTKVAINNAVEDVEDILLKMWADAGIVEYCRGDVHVRRCKDGDINILINWSRYQSNSEDD